jgi:serine protease AprX
MARPRASTTPSTKKRRSARRLRHLLPVLFLFGLLVGLVPPAGAADLDASRLEPSLAAAIARSPRTRFQVIVQAAPAKDAKRRNENQEKLAKLLREKDEDGNPGKIRTHLGLVDGFAADLSGKQIARLSTNPGVKGISGDHKVLLHQLATDANVGTVATSTTDGTTAAAPTTTTTTAPQSMQTIISQAPSVWQGRGIQGQGVTVAVLDSGIAPNADLNAAHGIDILTGTTGLSDAGGHGTHVAGVIAGTGAALAGKWKGAAPLTRVLSVKVTNDTGGASYSSIIKGLQWVVANRQAQNIRVVNMSLGAAPVTSYKDDPLAAATELVWFSGVVVVASAGNAGSSADAISVPGNDPYVITVGATNDKGTTKFEDDYVQWWSSRGPTRYDSLQKPDLVAGGTRVVSLRVPGSYLERRLGLSRVVDTHYFRLSGSSMAAPVVSGVAALVLAANPTLTPNQVKYVLKATARRYPYAGDANTQGAGQVDANAAVQMAVSDAAIPQANANQRPSNVFAHSIYTLALGAPVQWRDPNYLGRNWSSWSWESGLWDSATWDNLLWEKIDWINASWTSATWDSLTGWSSGTWDSGTWDSGTWRTGTWEVFQGD